jgi:putative DNA primase/helicase
LNLKNGLYDLDTGKLSEHTPDFLTTLRIPINYDPEATCPKIDTFFREVLKSEDIPILEEAFGFSLYPEYFIHKGFLLVGPGRNGKSTLLNLLEAFVGKDNVTNVLIHTLEFNRFAAAQLYNKLVLKNADLPDRTLKSTGMLKAIIGNDSIPAELKFKGGFDFRNHAKLFISTNSVPVTYDTTVAFFSRWIILNFPNQFFSDKSGEEEVKKAKTKILPALTTEDELSGLLNKGLEGLKRLLENEDFSYNKRAEEVAEEYMTLSDPIYGFISECCVLDSVGTISKDELYINYVNYCKAKNRIPATKNKFGRILPTIVTITDYTPRTGKNRNRAWKGLRIIKTVTEATEVTQFSNPKRCEENAIIYSRHKVEKNTLPSLPQVKQLSSMEKGICELCGKEQWLSHELIDGAQKCLICTKCASALNAQKS